MSKQILVSFPPVDYDGFIEESCIPAYEAAVVERLSAAFETKVEVDYSSGWGTKIVGDFDSPQEEEEAQDIIDHVLNQIGNDLTNICK